MPSPSPESNSVADMHLSPHMCDICEKTFSQACTVYRHKRNVHSGVKPYKCEECPAQYAQREKLMKHINRGKHYLEKEPYKCPHCDETMIFKSLNAWRKHFIKDRSLARDRASAVDTCCNMLKKNGSQKEQLMNGNTKCYYCEEMVATKDYFEKHVIADMEKSQGSTCVNSILKRPHITCYYCNEKLVTEDYRKHFKDTSRPIYPTDLICQIRSREYWKQRSEMDMKKYKMRQEERKKKISQEEEKLKEGN